MPSGFKFSSSSKGNAAAFFKSMGKVKGAYVKVGYPKGTFDTYPDKGKGGESMTTLDTAIINEFGVPEANIPARPSLSYTIRQNQGEIQKLQIKIAKGIAQGKVKNLTEGLALLGTRAKGWIQYNIKTWTTPPNAPSTIAKKGEDKPLRDSGKMMRSVTYKVEND